MLRIGVTMYTEIESSGSQAVKAQLRLRELILGGATHSIFRHMTAPVLMSH